MDHFPSVPGNMSFFLQDSHGIWYLLKIVKTLWKDRNAEKMNDEADKPMISPEPGTNIIPR
jgi:hypothetical protein